MIRLRDIFPTRSNHSTRIFVGMFGVLLFFSLHINHLHLAQGASGMVAHTHQETDEDTSLKFTCEARCGMMTEDLPCSCHALCFVYGTCCENITKDCPNVVSSALDSFAHLLDAKFVCGKAGVYVITTCPAGRNVSNETETTWLTEIAYKEIPSTGKRRVGQVDLSATEMQQAVLNALVTDGTSGFTFLNSVIYNCYARMGLASNALWWSLNTGPSKMAAILSTNPYFPSFDRDVILPHICVRGTIDSCESANMSSLRDSEKNYYSAKCTEFLGQVKSEIRRKDTYRNRFCAFCHEGEHSDMRLVGIGGKIVELRSVKFSTLVSITQNGFIQIKSESTDVKTGWKSAQCPNIGSLFLEVAKYDKGDQNVPVSIDAEEEENKADILPSCQIECHAEAGFTLHSDGRCKKIRYMKIAFSDESLGLEPLTCRSALDRVASFITCNLKRLLVVGEFKYAEFETTKVSVTQDLRTNKTLYVLDLVYATVGYSDPIYLFSSLLLASEMVTNLHKLAVSVKTYQSHRLSHSDLYCATIPGQAFLPQIASHTTETLEFNSVDEINYDFLQGMVNLRGPVIDGGNTTTLCVTKITMEALSVKPLTCLEDMVYMRDAVTISDLLNSTCIDILQQIDKPQSLFKNNAEDLVFAGPSGSLFKASMAIFAFQLA